MLDSEYFRKGLQGDVDALGGKAVVELHLTNGQCHRVRSVVAIHQGYVTLEVYRRQDGATPAGAWYEMDSDRSPAGDTERTVAPYESIASVRITPDAGGTSR